VLYVNVHATQKKKTFSIHQRQAHLLPEEKGLNMVTMIAYLVAHIQNKPNSTADFMGRRWSWFWNTFLAYFFVYIDLFLIIGTLVIILAFFIGVTEGLLGLK
jgi:ABC-type bacteriocin/lantibiotic exporter with double-glycine peptidase domain